MGDELEIVLMPSRTHVGSIGPSNEDRFNLAAYGSTIDEDPEEGELWERYTHQ